MVALCVIIRQWRKFYQTMRKENMAFKVEQLQKIGFTDTDCEAVAILEKALQTSHYPKGTYQPIGKPYMINFRKVTLQYFEYVKKQLAKIKKRQLLDAPDEFCPTVKTIGKGLRGLSDLLLGKDELPKRKMEGSESTTPPES
jgi:hypothetical protein